MKGFNLLLSLLKEEFKSKSTGTCYTIQRCQNIISVHLARTAASEKSGEQEFKKSFSSILRFTQYKSNSGIKTFHAMTSD